MASEWAEQREFIIWFKSKWPEHAKALRISLSGLNLGSKKNAARVMAQARAQGLVPGEADIVLLVPRDGFGCLICEHKALDGKHKTSDDQQAYIDYHNSQGNLAMSTKGLRELQTAVTLYMED